MASPRPPFSFVRLWGARALGPGVVNKFSLSIIARKGAATSGAKATSDFVLGYPFAPDPLLLIAVPRSRGLGARQINFEFRSQG
jgi:hypothetical protein